METQILPAQEKRVETGPVQFGNDWQGLFIRGDNAIGYMLALKKMLEKHPPQDIGEKLEQIELQNLCEMLESCIE